MIFLYLCFLLSGCASGGTKNNAAAEMFDEREENAEGMKEKITEEMTRKTTEETAENFLSNLDKIVFSL